MTSHSLYIRLKTRAHPPDPGEQGRLVDVGRVRPQLAAEEFGGPVLSDLPVDQVALPDAGLDSLHRLAEGVRVHRRLFSPQMGLQDV